MTKKHFIALADMVRNAKPAELTEPRHHAMLLQWERDRDMLASFCASQNAGFKRGRWMAYIAGECGPNGGKV